MVVIPVGIDLGSLHARIAVGESIDLGTCASDGSALPASTTRSSLPNVISNEQGSRYTVALSTPEILHSPQEGQDEEEEGEQRKKKKEEEESPSTKNNKKEVRFIFGEAARRALLKDSYPSSSMLMEKKLVRHLSTVSIAGSSCKPIFPSSSSLSSSSSSSFSKDGNSGYSSDSETETETENNNSNQYDDDDDDDEQQQQDALEASAAFFAHLAQLTSDATSQSIQNLRFVLSVPPNAPQEVIRGVLQSAKRGIQDALDIMETTRMNKHKKKKKKKQQQDEEEEEDDELVIGIISDPAAVCLVHGLLDVDERAVSNRIQLSPSTTATPSSSPPDDNSNNNTPKSYRNILVIDWGATGLTLTHLHRLGTSTIFTISDTRTNTNLKGDVFVETLIQHVCTMFERTNRLSPGTVSSTLQSNTKMQMKLQTACLEGIRTLSRRGANVVTIAIDGLYGGVDCHVTVSKPRVDMLCSGIMKRAEEFMAGFATQQQRRQQKTDAELFDAVLHSGNVSTLPSIQQLIAKLFPTDVYRGRDDVPPEEAVCMGCAMHASMLLHPYNRTVLQKKGGEGGGGGESTNHHALHHCFRDTSHVMDVMVNPVEIGICYWYHSDSEDDDNDDNSDHGMIVEWDDGMVNVQTLIEVGTPLPANVTRTIDLNRTGKKDNGNGGTTDLAIVQISTTSLKGDDDDDGVNDKKKRYYRVVGKIEDIPLDAKSVEVTVELGKDGTLTMAVNGGESVSV